MASPRLHPRRSSPSPLAPRAINTSITELSTPLALKKGSTFHSPTSPSSENDPVLNVPSLPKRSATNLKDLDDLVDPNPSERIARLIGAVDRSFSDLQSFATAADPVADALGTDVPPVPAFMVTQNRSADADLMDIDSKHPASAPASPNHARVHKHHASDSGIGSSLSSEAPMKQAAGAARPEGRVQTGINGVSSLAPSFSAASHHVLSEYACRQIQKHIILPIKREEKLKNFHPLVNGLPYRIARKEITCLRDLEKVLLWLAPCLHTAVEHLNDRDQRRPTDRPYTNGYFVDLVQQVRQYASQLAATRSRMAADERLELIGGLGQTGREAEIVHTKDGRSISLRTGEEVTEEYKQGLKRSSMEIEEELERSMARRRKNAPLEKQIQKCRECDKVFKRPCDLTCDPRIPKESRDRLRSHRKHEKTHSRPWKCSEVNCKYHEYGWPTEKERDRHVNDKHSAAPVLFKCKFHPCPYESKRESNCKQHMEKAHGWTYVKSKSNGKTTAKSPTAPGRTPPTPLDSASSEFTTSPSPQVAPAGYGTPFSHGRHTSTEASTIGDSSVVSPDLEFRRMFGTGEPVFGWSDNSDDIVNDLFGVNVESSRSWNDFTTINPTVQPSDFNDMFNEDEPIFGPNFDWSNMDQDLTSMNVQLATPPLSLEPLPAEILKNMPVSTLSPQQQAMLYSPYSMNSNNDAPLDEAYCGEFPQELVTKPLNDFSLFDANTVSSLNTSTKDAMFDDLSNFGTYARNDYSMDYMPMRE